jgi:hypothetical protein
MKNTIFTLLGTGILTAATLAFTAHQPRTDGPSNTNSFRQDAPKSASAIKGRIDPTDAASFVVAISSMDSTRAAITDGMFTINTKAGSYKVIVVAKSPYKDVVKDNVEVADGNTTDLGTITLQQ